MTNYLVTITAYDPAVPGVITLYYSTEGYTTGPADSPANTFYAPRVKNPGLFRYDMYAPGKTGGQSTTGFGEVVLINLDGALDGLISYGLDGRVIEIAEVTANGIAPFLVGTMEQPVFSLNEVSIRIRDRQAELNVPFQPTKYAGTNSLPAGLEGVDDIKGKPKPRLYGVCYNVTPVLVNTSRLIYQLSDIALNSVDNVYDRAVSLTKGADYTSQVDMETTAPAAGTFRAWPAGGYFRLGSSPAGQITADATQGAAAANRTVAQIVKQIVQIPIAAADCIEQGFIDLDKANASVVGIYVADETTYAAVIDELCVSVGAWYGFENKGKFCLRRLELPGTTAITTINDAKILSMERIATNDQGRGVPAYQVNLSYAKNYTPQPSDLAASVTDVRRQWIREQYRTVKSTDAAVKTAHLLAPELNITTLLTSSTDAQTESDRVLTLHKSRRDYVKTAVPRSQLLYDVAGYWDNEAISDLAATRSYSAAVVYGSHLYVIGGKVAGAASASVIRLDLSNPTGAWDDAGVTDLPATRYSHSAVVYGSYLYVIGGTVAGAASTSVIRLDLSNPAGAWDDAGVTDMPAPRGTCAAIMYGSHVYCVGGVVSGAGSASVIRLDLASPTGAWDDAGVTDLPAARYTHTTGVYGTYLYVAGGIIAGNKTASVIRLDLSSPTGAWDDAGVADLPTVLSGHSTVVLGDYLHVIGGRTGSTAATVTAAVRRLDLSDPNGAWDDAGTADLPEKREWSAAVVYGNILVVGGISTVADVANTYLFRSNSTPDDLAHVWDRNKVVKLETDRFGYNSNKYMRIVGAEVDLAAGAITLYLWG